MVSADEQVEIRGLKYACVECHVNYIPRFLQEFRSQEFPKNMSF